MLGNLVACMQLNAHKRCFFQRITNILPFYLWKTLYIEINEQVTLRFSRGRPFDLYTRVG